MAIVKKFLIIVIFTKWSYCLPALFLFSAMFTFCSFLVPTLFLISTMFTFCFALVPTLLLITFCLPSSCSVPVEVFHEHLLDSIACWVLVHAFKELVELRTFVDKMIKKSIHKHLCRVNNRKQVICCNKHLYRCSQATSVTDRQI